MLHTARVIILTELFSRNDVEHYSDLPSELFQEYEQVYLDLLSMIAGDTSVSQIGEATKDFIGATPIEIPFEPWSRLIDRLYEEYKSYLIRTIHPKDEEEMEALLFKIRSLAREEEMDTLDILGEIYLEIQEGRTKGILTGIKEIDEDTVGLKEGHIWVIGGWTGAGKSMLTNDIVMNVAKDHEVLMYSLEMSRKEVLERMLRKLSRKMPIPAAIDHIMGLKLEIINKKNSLTSILMDLSRRTTKPKVVVIDFIGLIRTSGKSTEATKHIALSLQSFAKAYDICIIEVSQISKAANNGETNDMGFKDAMDVEAAADVGIKIERDFKKEAELLAQGISHVPFKVVLGKNRHGKTAVYPWQFNKDCGEIIYHNS